MPLHFSHRGADGFFELADERSELLDKLDSDEALEVLFAFAVAEELITPADPGNRLRLSADGEDDSITLELAVPGVRKEKAKLALSEALDWDNARGTADACSRALVTALQAANAIEVRSRLP